MDDWEVHFAEKSRRRFEKERLKRRRRITRSLIGVAVAGGILAAAILGFGLLK